MTEVITKRIIADDGKVLVRKADGFVMGTRICLGRNDVAESYEEREMTDVEKEKYRDPFAARREEMRRIHEERRAEILARIKAKSEEVTNA